MAKATSVYQSHDVIYIYLYAWCFGTHDAFSYSVILCNYAHCNFAQQSNIYSENVCYSSSVKNITSPDQVQIDSNELQCLCFSQTVILCFWFVLIVPIVNLTMDMLTIVITLPLSPVRSQTQLTHFPMKCIWWLA